MKMTVFVGCDFAKDGPYRTITRVLKDFARPGLTIYPIVSNSAADTVIEAFGHNHPQIRQLTSSGLTIRISAMIRNCDIMLFDITGYKKSRYCLNVIHELGIATGYTIARRNTDARFFCKRGLEWIKDVSNLQGGLPLTSRPYKSMIHLGRQLRENLLPLIEMKRLALSKRPAARKTPKRSR